MKRDREMSDEGGRRREEAPLTVSLPLCGIAGEDAHVPGLGKFNMMCQMYTFYEHPHGDVDAHNLHRSGYIILNALLPKLPFLSIHILTFYRIIYTFYYQNTLKVLIFVKCPPLIGRNLIFFCNFAF